MDKKDNTIFVVDNDASVGRALKRLITSFGFNVKAFESAREFLDSGHHRGAGILVLDVRMPGMTGLELQEQLAASGSKMPVIFITAHEDIQTRKTALETGAVAFLRKPVDDQMLFDAVNLALDRIASDGIDAYPQSAETKNCC